MLKTLFIERFWQNNLAFNWELCKLALQFRAATLVNDHIVNSVYIG